MRKVKDGEIGPSSACTHELVDRTGKPITAEPDLNEMLADAVSRGLTHLTLFRVGATTIMWQASCRGRGDTAYRVAIEADPVTALCSVMSGTVVPTMPAPLVEDIFA